MHKFVQFLFGKTYSCVDKALFQNMDKHIDEAVNKTVKDVQYHFPGTDEAEVRRRIQNNSNELAVFLYRLGNESYKEDPRSGLINNIHWLMKECCCCEIYFSNLIDEGFYVMHGLGTVVGSRNRIGKGFKIYQNCTVGHKKDGEEGATIGDDVTMFANSNILGSVKIGNKVVLGAGAFVMNDVPDGTVCYGQIPGKNKQ